MAHMNKHISQLKWQQMDHCSSFNSFLVVLRMRWEKAAELNDSLQLHTASSVSCASSNLMYHHSASPPPCPRSLFSLRLTTLCSGATITVAPTAPDRALHVHFHYISLFDLQQPPQGARVIANFGRHPSHV